ncbi:NBR1-Ig-like domain-containing protein [Flexilinea flocculi]|uniref:Nbr1 FW domain-containing protein n=1 Tax=Flexilinea flocculi TaxID=1678840 RepID=A0A0S7BK99_9CHLR|nr:NBR1-Ig-like domain-containing protein [Flexilinea flocculi]GAP40780.1 hypothetical protein ATC1_13760 [Flexilinea flocculi]
MIKNKNLKRYILCFLLAALLSGCTAIGNPITVRTPDLDATLYWMVDDAVSRVSTQIVHELDMRFDQLLTTTTEVKKYSQTVAITPDLAGITSVPSGLMTARAGEMSTLFPCVDELKFVADITIPDKTTVQAGKPFTKTWKIRNNGTCTWTDSYKLVFSKGDQMTDKKEINLPEGTIVLPDDTIEISVYMTAPKEKGSYASFWLMKSPDQKLFGAGTNRDQAIWVKVEVK